MARLRRGERIEHFDTVRLAKDGRRVDISLAVSPIRDSTGRVTGASKVARDVTERKEAEKLQRLLVDQLQSPGQKYACDGTGDREPLVAPCPQFRGFCIEFHWSRSGTSARIIFSPSARGGGRQRDPACRRWFHGAP